MSKQPDHRSVQVNRSAKDDQSIAQSPRASPGEAGKIWWNQVNGWRNNLGDEPDGENVTTESRQIGGSLDRPGDNSYDRSHELQEQPDRRNGAASNPPAHHATDEVDDDQTECLDHFQRKSVPAKVGGPDPQAPQTPSKPKRRGAIDFIKQRTVKREEKAAEAWYRK